MKIYFAILVFMLMKNTLTEKYICAIQISNEALIEKISQNKVGTEGTSQNNLKTGEQAVSVGQDKDAVKLSEVGSKTGVTKSSEQYDEAHLKKIPALHIMGIYIKDEPAQLNTGLDENKPAEVKEGEEEDGKKPDEVKEAKADENKPAEVKEGEEEDGKKPDEVKEKKEAAVDEKLNSGKYKLDAEATDDEIKMGIKLMNALADHQLKNDECAEGFEKDDLIGCAKKEKSIPFKIKDAYFNTLKKISASCRPLEGVEKMLTAIEVNVHYRELPKEEITTDEIGKVYADLLNNPAKHRLTDLKSDRVLKVDNAKFLSESKSSAFDLSSLLSIENLELRSPNLKIVSPMLLDVDNSRLLSII